MDLKKKKKKKKKKPVTYAKISPKMVNPRDIAGERKKKKKKKKKRGIKLDKQPSTPNLKEGEQNPEAFMWGVSGVDEEQLHFCPS